MSKIYNLTEKELKALFILAIEYTLKSIYSGEECVSINEEELKKIAENYKEKLGITYDDLKRTIELLSKIGMINEIYVELKEKPLKDSVMYI